MKQILKKLKEFIDDDPNTIQFKTNNSYYELDKTKNDAWYLITVFGEPLNLNIKKLTGLEREDVVKVLKRKFDDLKLY